MAEPVSEGARYVIVVKQGHSDLYLALQDGFADPGQVQVTWDRRAGERRLGERRAGSRPDSTDRRGGDRRRAGLLDRLVAFLLPRPPSQPPSESRPAA